MSGTHESVRLERLDRLEKERRQAIVLIRSMNDPTASKEIILTLGLDRPAKDLYEIDLESVRPKGTG